MASVANRLQQRAVPGIALSVTTLRISWLEDCFEVIEEQHTRLFAQQPQKHFNPCRIALGRHHLLA